MRLLQQLFQGVLPILRRAADGVEETKVAVDFGLAVFLHHGPAQAPLHFFGLAAEHGGLVGDADGLQVNVGIEAVGIRAFELLQEGRLVAAVDHVVADVVGFGQREHDQVMAAAVGHGLRAGRLGLLVPGLAVDDAGDLVLGVLPHALPNAHHVAAGRIDEPAAFGFELLPHRDFRPEGGNDDDVVFLQVRDVGVLLLAGEELDAHRADLVVDFRVVDDLAEDINRLLGEDLARGIGQVNGPLDAVAEAELLGELDGQVARRKDMPAAPDALDQVAAIMREDLGLNRRHDIGAAEVDFLRRGRRFG